MGLRVWHGTAWHDGLTKKGTATIAPNKWLYHFILFLSSTNPWPTKKGIATIDKNKPGILFHLVPELYQSQPHLAKQEFPCCVPAMSKDRGCSLF